MRCVLCIVTHIRTVFRGCDDGDGDIVIGLPSYYGPCGLFIHVFYRTFV